MKNQKGFTLIELLVVIAILGILAAIIVPNVTNYLGSGNVAAANSELHIVSNATIAYMADNKLVALPDTYIVKSGSTDPIGDFINGDLKGTYFIDTDGSISGATAKGGSYPNLNWDDTTKQWIK